MCRWWKDYGFLQITFSWHSHVEYYTLAACIANDLKLSAFRLGFGKICHMIMVLDDIYNTFGTMEVLEISGNFREILNRENTLFLLQYLLYREAPKNFVSKAKFFSQNELVLIYELSGTIFFLSLRGIHPKHSPKKTLSLLQMIFTLLCKIFIHIYCCKKRVFTFTVVK